MVGYLFLIFGFFLVLRRRPDRRLYVLEGAVADVGLLCREITLTLIPLMVLVRVVRDRLPLKALLEELFTVSFIAALHIVA